MDDKTFLAWTQEVYKEFQNTNQKIEDSKSELKGDMVEMKEDLRDEISKNREEFVIHKTKVNTRTALIATSIGAVFAIISLLSNFGIFSKHKESKEKQVKETIYEPGVFSYKNW